jgi:hypothetical protein
LFGRRPTDAFTFIARHPECIAASGGAELL